MAAQLRRPTAESSWTRALLTGEEGTQAAWMAAEFTGDPRLAASFWLEVGLDANADLYAQADGADFEIICHDGTWQNMYDQLCAVWDDARDAAEAGYPSALVVTSMSGVWSMLTDAADIKERRRHGDTLKVRGIDPAKAYASEVPVVIAPDMWKVMTRRHGQLMSKILTWPGPVIMTAREKRSAEGHWQLKAHEQLGFDCTAWIRLSREDEPEIVVLDTAQHQRMTRPQREALRSQFTLPRLVWDWSGCSTSTRAPAPRRFDADQVMPGEQPPSRKLQAVKPHVPSRRELPSTMLAAREPATAEEPLPPVAERISHIFDAWLQLSDRRKVTGLWDQMLTDLDGQLHTNVYQWLSPEQREALNLPDATPYPLLEFADRVARHVRRTGTTLFPVEAAAS